MSGLNLESLLEEIVEQCLDEFNAIGGGNICGGPMTPLGMGIKEKTWFPDEQGENVKTASPGLHEETSSSLEEMVEEAVNKALMKKMGYDFVGGYKGLNTDTYIKKNSPRREKDIIKKVNKNLDRPSGRLNKQPPTMGSVSWDK